MNSEEEHKSLTFCSEAVFYPFFFSSSSFLSSSVLHGRWLLKMEETIAYVTQKALQSDEGTPCMAMTAKEHPVCPAARVLSTKRVPRTQFNRAI
jgi:hypothetical protein